MAQELSLNITPAKIIRAKQKVEKLKENNDDAPIINVFLSLERIEEKERAILKEIEYRKSIQELEVAKVIEMKDNLIDEKGFLEAKQMVDKKDPSLKLSGIFGKIISGIWKDLLSLPRKTVQAWFKLDPTQKLHSIVCLIVLIFCFYYAVFIVDGSSIGMPPNNHWDIGAAKVMCFLFLAIVGCIFTFPFSDLFIELSKYLSDRYVNKK